MGLHNRLFTRLILKNREVYILKIVSLAIAFACSALVVLFSFSEFGYDRFHTDPDKVFRVLQRSNSEVHEGNRLSARISNEDFRRWNDSDSIILSRIKVLNEVGCLANNKLVHGQTLHVADAAVVDVFSFEIIKGSAADFKNKLGTALISSSVAEAWFPEGDAIGKNFPVFTGPDTLVFQVSGVFKDFPSNSHEAFNGFIRFDSASVNRLGFDPNDSGVYGRYNGSNLSAIKFESTKPDITFYAQPLPEIYFGPRVLGEETKHGDRYSILILVCITSLILFLALSGFINLTTLTLPARAKELAVKKLAGTSQIALTIEFIIESLSITLLALVLGVATLILSSKFVAPLLLLDVTEQLLRFDSLLIAVMAVLVVASASMPLMVISKFTKATPIRLLSTDRITFPRLKRNITVIQLGISMFLLVASGVIKRQVNYSLLKEPGRNHEQVVYLNYPSGLTNEGLLKLREDWKKYNANIVDVIATSHLPNRITSKEINSPYYVIKVDPHFASFFDLKITEGNWFSPNDEDSILVLNKKGAALAGKLPFTIGVIEDLSHAYNQPEKPVKIKLAEYIQYNFLCVRILEVDIRKTMQYLERTFAVDGQKAAVKLLDSKFELWLTYQDKLNTLSEILTVISALLAAFAIYGLSISLVQDKLKQLAVHKICGAETFHVARLLVLHFAGQLLMAVLMFAPITYIFLNELLRNFVYSTPFNWLDPIIPVGYCALVIVLLCLFQAINLGRKDLAKALKSD